VSPYTGIQAARGVLVALLGSDDLWHPRKLELQSRYLTEHPVVGMVAADSIPDRGKTAPCGSVSPGKRSG
jgi:hypothetical protein